MGIGHSGTGGGGFPTGIKTFVTEIIAYDGDSVNILSAIPQINFSNETGSYGVQLSNDGGVSWENASNNVEHVFVSVGQKLMLKITGMNVVVGSELLSDGKTYVPAIRVDYSI